MNQPGDDWEKHADWWQREFTDGVDPEYTEQIVPILEQRLERSGVSPDVVLDLGTGEGQLARVVADVSGALVVGLDQARAQVGEAARRGGGPAYVRASCSHVPLADGTVDAVVVCLVLEHVDDLDETLAELGRVTRQGGVLLLFLNHPLIQTPGSGMIVDHLVEPPETYWRVGPYLTEQATIETVQKGVSVRFVHRPLHRYVNGLLDAGFDITGMEEPAPPPGFVAKAVEYEHEVVRTTPRLMVIEARRATGEAR